jgi:hypothetical protein
MPPLPLIGSCLRIEWAPVRASSGEAKDRQFDTRTVNKIHKFAQVAQLVEHVTENHGVGGSIPPLGTTLQPFQGLMVPKPGKSAH